MLPYVIGTKGIIFCGLFIDALSTLFSTASSNWMIVNNVLEKMRKEV
jgi:hypothetical protein